MKIIYLLIFLLILSYYSISQIPAGYYDSAAGLNGISLKNALHDIIKNHTVIPYDDLHDYYDNTDQKPNGKVWDIYSDIPGGTPPYEYDFIAADQCGSYSTEGDCYNREHTWPKSWFGGEISPMNSDLFIVYPTDGYVNGIRANDPYGEINSPSWTSLNGSKSGNCSYPGYSQGAFEPIDEYKGDLARTFFYISVRYYGEDGSWPGSAQADGAELLPWALNMMYQWHINDTVSQKEIDRNNAVHDYQYNRNPFIDHPEWVDSVWFPLSINENQDNSQKLNVYPNPVINSLNITCDQEIVFIEIADVTGKLIFSDKDCQTRNYTINTSYFENGYYLLRISTKNHTTCRQIIITK